MERFPGVGGGSANNANIINFLTLEGFRPVAQLQYNYALMALTSATFVQVKGVRVPPLNNAKTHALSSEYSLS